MNAIRFAPLLPTCNLSVSALANFVKPVDFFGTVTHFGETVEMQVITQTLERKGHSVPVAAIVSAVLGLCQFLLSSVSISLANAAAANQANRLRALFYKAVLRQEVAWHDKNGGSGSCAEQLSQ